MTSDNVLSADNQQERQQTIHPWYISGFVDGEGSFHIAFCKDKNMKTNLKVIPEFHISQNDHSVRVLENIQNYLHCGHIKENHHGRKNDQTFVYVVRNRIDLSEKIIPFFQKYHLRTQKAKDFEKFAKIVQKMNTGYHTSIVGAKEIINLAYTMNDNGKHRIISQNKFIRIVESSETIREAPVKIRPGK